jgi:hypothetical protein
MIRGGALALVAIPFLLPGAAAAGPRPSSEVSVDAGLVVPRGDLGDSFTATRLGFGAEPGVEVGFRWRYWFSTRWSLAPAFHYVAPRGASGLTDTAAEYQIRTRTFGYTLEVMRIFGAPDDGWRLFAAAGSGLFRNRLSGLAKDLQTPLAASAFSLGHFARAGLRAGSFELSLIYTLNRFATWRFFWTGQDQPYDWDMLGVRAGWVLPLGG